MGGPETRAKTRRSGRSVLARVAKPVDGDENRVFHRGIAANLPAAINQRLVLKLAQVICIF
jgi:hypothetical protein